MNLGMNLFIGTRVTNSRGNTFTVLRFEQEAQGVRAFIRWDNGREHNFIVGAVLGELPTELLGALSKDALCKVESPKQWFAKT